jgi:hypothetical protein
LHEPILQTALGTQRGQVGALKALAEVVLKPPPDDNWTKANQDAFIVADR